MQNTQSYDNLLGADVVDRNGDRVGEISDVYYDDVSGRPEWIAIKAGLFKGIRIAPLAGARLETDDATDDDDDDMRLVLGVDKDAIDKAPHDFDDDGHLTPDVERSLYAHYGFNWDQRTESHFGYGAAYEPQRWDKDYVKSRPASGQDTMTRSEEELRVDKTRQQTGTARLRKYVVTENVNVQVPIEREVARVVREPATGRTGEHIGTDEAEITLSEERAVVTKETVPKEKVRLEKETVRDTQTVNEQVRKERVETEGVADRPKGRTK
jgi:uncharacterized protein (TIGR02271 family)